MNSTSRFVFLSIIDNVGFAAIYTGNSVSHLQINKFLN